MKKILLSVIIAATAISICGCGHPEKKTTETQNGNTSVSTTRKVEKTTVGTRQVIAPITQETGDFDDISKLSGSYIESIDGKETNYIFINSLGNTAIGIGQRSPTPIGIETSKEGIMVYRGSKTPGDAFSAYTFDGNTLKFKAYGKDYEWKRVDKVDIFDSYTLVEDGKFTDVWVFDNGKLTVSHQDQYQEYTYKQTADKLIVTDAEGKTAEYDYEYDIFSLELKNDKQELYFRAMI